MILRRIQARGFMRYQVLDLAALPADGVIAVIGENESGKTTIGEAIAFGLFGETVKSRATDVSQVVSWDAEQAVVGIDFEAKGASYRIERKVDKRGLHEARIEKDGELSAQGPEAVALAVQELSGLTFDEFRASFYLAQAELGLVRRSDADGDGRQAILEIVGVAALERASAAARADARTMREKLDGLAREHAVAKALADAQALPENFGAELDREHGQLDKEAGAAREALPDLEGRINALRAAVHARAGALNAFQRLECVLMNRRADAAATAAGREVAQLTSGLQNEQKRVARELQNREKRATDVRQSVDRLIDYQSKIGELQARIDLYRLEVKRALEAPTLDAEDVAALDGLAMPSTPAAGLKLAEARAGRMTKSRNRAIKRSILFLVIALLLGTAGLPALSHVWPADTAHGSADARNAETGIAAYLERGVEQLFETGRARDAAWLAIMLAGCGGGLLFLVLSGLQLRHSLSRTDTLKLALESGKRLQTEVKELEEEREKLERLDLKKPVKFAEAVKLLKNPTLREQFEKVRELHNDFIQSSEQGDELVSRSRTEESQIRVEVGELESRLARLTRIAQRLPACGKGDVPAPSMQPKEIGTNLDPVEAHANKLADAIDTAERDRREVARRAGGNVAGDADALLAELWKALEDVATSLPAADGETIRKLRARSRLSNLVTQSAGMEPSSLRDALQSEQGGLQQALPSESELVSELESLQQERRETEGRHARAEARLGGMAHQVDELRARRRREAEHRAKARQVEDVLRPMETDFATRELAADLLQETADDLRRRVGPMLSRYAAAVLPRLTNGRYRKVKVGSDLEIRVYSPDKNDYVPLVDLSVGAADQLLLALRLGLARAVIAAKGLGDEKHFLFLDEPMASFDAGRAQAFLQILAEHRSVFPQSFIVGHHHIDGLAESFERVIETTLESRALRVAEAPPEIEADEPAQTPDDEQAAIG